MAEATIEGGGAASSTQQPRPEDEAPENNNDGINNGNEDDSDDKQKDAATDATAESAGGADDAGNKKSSGAVGADGAGPVAILSTSKKSRPSYKYDPNKITLRFLFANRDGLAVTVECQPADTVGEVKGALLSVWPSDLPDCSGGDRLRLVCMGKGYLMPDTRTLEELQIPVFKTHPTPINVSVKPADDNAEADAKNKKGGGATGGDGGDGTGAGAGGGRGSSSGTAQDNTSQTSQGCTCVIL